MNFLFNYLKRRGFNKYLREYIIKYIKDIVAFFREIKFKNNNIKRGKDIL